MNKTNGVQKVREREGERGEEGEPKGRNGPVCISAPLSLGEGFIKKSVSRAWWSLCVSMCVHVRVRVCTRVCACVRGG